MLNSSKSSLKEKNLNILFVIPARKGSKRLPGKNNKRIRGKSLLKHKIDYCRNSNLGNIVVSSDCPLILKEAEDYKLEFIRKRPKNLSGDGPTTPIVHDAVNFYEKKSNKKADLVILSQITTPFILDSDFKKSVKIYLDSKNTYKSLIACKKVNNDFLWALYQNTKGQSYKIPDSISKELKKFFIGKDAFIPNGGIYIINRLDLKKNGHFYETPAKIFQMDRKQSIDIDYKEDLELAKIVSEDFF